jgi:hypothetical protein
MKYAKDRVVELTGVEPVTLPLRNVKLHFPLRSFRYLDVCVLPYSVWLFVPSFVCFVFPYSLTFHHLLHAYYTRITH